MKKMNKKAFTLIELLIVIAIIGILFIVLVSKVDFATDKAKATGVQTDFRSFQMAFETVARENAGFTSLLDFEADGEAVYSKLEDALNKNLDAKLQVEIDEDGMITMRNGTLDPWKTEYYGYFNSGDLWNSRGMVIMGSCAADLTQFTQDDMYICVEYWIGDGAGEVRTTTEYPTMMLGLGG